MGNKKPSAGRGQPPGEGRKTRATESARKTRRAASGGSWSAESIADAARSFRDPEKLLRAANARSLNPSETKAECGASCASTFFPNHDTNGNVTDNPTIRLHRIKPPKYKRRKGSRPAADFTGGQKRKWLAIVKDVTRRIYITEGIKKSLAATLNGYDSIAIDGNWSHQSKKKGIAFLPELEAVEWCDREAHLVPDSDFETNDQVRLGWLALAAKLRARGANVFIVRLPQDGDDKVGWDDYLLEHTREDFDALPTEEYDIRAAIAGARAAKAAVHDKRKAISALILADMQQRGRFFQTVLGETFFIDEQEHVIYDMSDPKKGAFRAYQNEHYDLNGTEKEYDFVHEELRAYTQRHGPVLMPALFAYYDTKGCKLYINAGNNRSFRITTQGCDVVDNGTDGVLFGGLDIEPIKPAARGSRKALRQMFDAANFKGSSYLSPADERMLFELWALSVLFPELAATRALLLLVGLKGSGKTSALRRLLHLFFGRQHDVKALNPKKEDAAVALFTTLPLVALDNVDGKIPWLDNLLAVAATGGSVPLRKLYVTNELVDYPLRSFVGATSRDPKSFARDDVADRALILHVDRRKTFISEQAFNNETAELRPRAWAALLEVLPKVLAALRRHRPGKVNHRMADFADFCLAVGPVLGYSTSQVRRALEAAERVRSEFVLEHSPLRQALQYWSENPHGSIGKEITTGDLFKQVISSWPPGSKPPFSRPQDFATALWNQLDDLRADFDIVTRDGTQKRRYIKLMPKRATTRAKFK